MILLREDAFAKDIMREEIMGRHHLRLIYFGCGPKGCVM